jgi:hypothetical protein
MIAAFRCTGNFMLKTLTRSNLRKLASRLVRSPVSLPPSDKSIKVRHEAKAEYEAGWGSVLERAHSLKVSRERNLARVLSLLEKPGPIDAINPLLERVGFRFCGARVRAPRNWSYESPLFELLLQHEILSQIDGDTERVVELGSGYGKNLFRLWLNGGPQDATYYGLEYTRRGRECADFLASLEPSIRFRSQPFDYHDVNLQTLVGSAKTFIFTSYSIEQVPEIDSALFAALAACAGVYKVMHIEPVGWQRQDDNSLDPEDRLLLQDMERSARDCHYNTNLLQVLDDLATAGQIVIDQKKYDFLAHRPDLPGSVIVWHPARRSTAPRSAAF